MFERLRLGPRLALAIGLILSAFIVTMAVLWYSLTSVVKQSEEVDQSSLPLMMTADHMVLSIAQVQQFLTDVSATKEPDAYAEAEASAKDFRAGVAQFEAYYQKQGDKLQAQSMRLLEQRFDSFYALGKRMADAYVKQGTEAGNQVMRSFDKESEDLQNAVGEFREAVLKNTNTASASVVSSGRFMIKLLIACTLIGAIISFMVGRLLMLSIVGPVAKSVTVARSIATGDLTRAIPPGGRDELGELLNCMASMQASLRDLVSGANDNANRLIAAASQLSTTSNQAAAGAQEQSATTAGMASSIEEMSASIDAVGERAQEAKAISEYSSDQSDAGGKVVHSAADEMRLVADAVNASAQSIRDLENYSQEISAIVNVIREIADQTNLLALNAAIEAARAGEQGRGFAVVADEVRKLAERTGQSTQQISAMIGKVQAGTRKAVEEMGAGVERVNQGVTLAHQAGDSITGIQNSEARIIASVEGIADALREQSVAARKFANDVERIAQMSEENSQVASQVAASSATLESLSQNLQATVSRFRT
jgi:methyl-accepting chemotaxis protein